MFKNVIWATDGSEAAERALPTALELVEDSHGKLFVVHADEILGGRAGGFSGLADEEDVREQIEAKVADLVAAGVDAEFRLVTGVQRDAADLLADEAAKLGADVIVVGSRGHGRVAGMLLGSATQRLLHVSPCAVLAVPSNARFGVEQEKVAAGAP
jgi:nucleotide-binding universal stress UspA family protein